MPASSPSGCCGRQKCKCICVVRTFGSARNATAGRGAQSGRHEDPIATRAAVGKSLSSRNRHGPGRGLHGGFRQSGSSDVQEGPTVSFEAFYLQGRRLVAQGVLGLQDSHDPKANPCVTSGLMLPMAFRFPADSPNITGMCVTSLQSISA